MSHFTLCKPANLPHNRWNYRLFLPLPQAFFEFVTREAVAKKAVELVGSKSPIEVVDKGWDPKPALFDMGMIKKEFGLEFVATPEIGRHLEY